MRQKNKQQKIDAVCTAAIMCIGTPYQYGAYAQSQKNDIEKGVDCSSFIQYVFGTADIALPRSSLLQATKGKTIKNKKAIIPGDLLFFEGDKGHYFHPLFKEKKVLIGHVALYVGNGAIIHARQAKKGVAIERLASYEKKKYCTLVRIQRII